ncbi:MAG: peptide chain release factor-like protein [Planctomycetota bacterium]
MARTLVSSCTSCSRSTRDSERGGVFDLEVLDLRPHFVSLRVTGKGARAAFEREAGGHRWQRVPPTEKRGRVHSSTVTVAVLREPSAHELVLDARDLRIETVRGTGPGGQHKNKTESAVRITHIPTGTTASADSRSQHQNRELALAVLRARLLEQRAVAEISSRNEQRRQQVGSGQRADKIRTVSEQNGVVTNHQNGKRLDLKTYKRGFVEQLY